MALLSAGYYPQRRPKVFIADGGTAGWHLALTVTPKEPRPLDLAQFRVSVTDKNQRPIAGAAVTARLAMPAMGMGENAVALREGPRGIYTGTGRFTMAGDWQAAVSADKGAVHGAQSFPISVH